MLYILRIFAVDRKTSRRCVLLTVLQRNAPPTRPVQSSRSTSSDFFSVAKTLSHTDCRNSAIYFAGSYLLTFSGALIGV